LKIFERKAAAYCSFDAENQNNNDACTTVSFVMFDPLYGRKEGGEVCLLKSKILLDSYMRQSRLVSLLIILDGSNNNQDSQLFHHLAVYIRLHLLSVARSRQVLQPKITAILAPFTATSPVKIFNAIALVQLHTLWTNIFFSTPRKCLLKWYRYFK
jgi:hypothetical protein